MVTLPLIIPERSGTVFLQQKGIITRKVFIGERDDDKSIKPWD
jgi:hypothetical protein